MRAQLCLSFHFPLPLSLSLLFCMGIDDKCRFLFAIFDIFSIPMFVMLLTQEVLTGLLRPQKSFKISREKNSYTKYYQKTLILFKHSQLYKLNAF